MADEQTRTLTPKKFSTNDAAFAALQNMTGYTPANLDYRLPDGINISAAISNARKGEVQAIAALKTARGNAVASGWAMHNYVLSAKDRAAAQYGKSSNEYQSPGMKKKTEYNKPKKKSAQ